MGLFCTINYILSLSTAMVAKLEPTIETCQLLRKVFGLVLGHATVQNLPQNGILLTIDYWSHSSIA